METKQLNKKKVVVILKRQMKEICKDCSKNSLGSCYSCPVYKLVNNVLKALDNGDIDA